jgi:hypothetical protein
MVPRQREACAARAHPEAAFLGDDADFPDSPDRQAGYFLALEPAEAGVRVGGDAV